MPRMETGMPRDTYRGAFFKLEYPLTRIAESGSKFGDPVIRIAGYSGISGRASAVPARLRRFTNAGR